MLYALLSVVVLCAIAYMLVLIDENQDKGED